MRLRHYMLLLFAAAVVTLCTEYYYASQRLVNPLPSDVGEVSDDGRRSREPPPRSVPGSSVRDIRFFCLQTKQAKAWCSMLRSASAHGVVVHHPAWGKKYAHAKRIGWVLDAVAGLPDNTVVAFNDGTDVMFNGGPEKVMARFESLERKWGRHLFFNAEKSCYGPQAFSTGSCASKQCKWAVRKARCITSYRNTLWTNTTQGLSKWRYLNAGCFVGRVSAVKTFFQRVAEVTYTTPGGRTLRPGVWCDQSMITKVLLSSPDLLARVVALDVENRVYLPTYHLHPAVDFCPNATIHTCHNADNPGEEPLIFHLNGKSAGILTSHYKGMRWDTNDGSAQHVISGTRKPLSSICPRE